MNDEARGQEPAGLARVVHGEHRQEVRLLLRPGRRRRSPSSRRRSPRCSGAACSSSCRARCRPGGLTLANFRARAGAAVPRTRSGTRVVLSAATTVLTLVPAYPVAYALARTPSRRVRSALLVLTLAPVLHRRHRAHLRLGARARQHRGHLAGADALHRARRPRRPRPLLDADHDPASSPPRSATSIPCYERAAASLGRAPGARLPARDAAAVHAGHRLGLRSSSSPGRSQRLRHAGAARRRQGQDDRQRREGPGARLLQLARRARPSRCWRSRSRWRCSRGWGGSPRGRRGVMLRAGRPRPASPS